MEIQQSSVKRVRGRRLGRAILGLELAGTMILVVAWFWTGDFRETSLGAVLLAWFAFLVRTCMFQIGLTLGVAMVVFLGLRAWRLAMGALPALVLCFIPSAMSLVPRETEAIEGKSLRVMSFNVLANNRADAAILGEIREHDPDLLFVQEVTKRRHELFVEELGEEYPFVYRVAWKPWFGMSVFAKRELLEPREIFGGHGREALRFKIRVGDGEATVWAIHPPHPVLPGQVRVGRHQFADLLDDVRATGGAKIIVGDCNWGVTSPQAAVLAGEGFRDAFDLGGSGRGVTYAYRGIRRFVAAFRIDHVYVSEELACERAWNGDPSGSDHRPIVAEVGWGE